MARIEILAPVGSEEMLRAAVFSGADAVYLGFSGFNARTGAGNFDADSLQEAVRFCHARGVAVHVALNTTVYGTELPALEQAIRAVAASGADAVICQDLAVATLIGKIAPQLPRHGSTQMSVHTLQGALELKELGFTRVVLARELSLPEVEHITKHCGIETECFIHGALCMSVSGQCYMSAFLGGRSGNRGSCAGPCRLPFEANALPEGKPGRLHHLSLKDNSAIDKLDKLQAIGVASAKIEGRLRTPEYVAAAVSACLAGREGRAYDRDLLKNAFSRSGFTSGYLDGKIDGTMFGVRSEADAELTKKTLPMLRELYRRERSRVPVQMKLEIEEGGEKLTVTDADGNKAFAYGDAEPQPARTDPTESLNRSLTKTGGTPFTAEKITVEMDGGPWFIPGSAVNELRREALDALLKKQNAQLKTQDTAVQSALEDSRQMLRDMEDEGLLARGTTDVKPEHLGSFEGLAAEVKKTVLGQDAFVDSVVRAMRRPFVLGTEGAAARNVILLWGDPGTGRHFALAETARIMAARGLLQSDRMAVMDLALYPDPGAEKLFLQDLYAALHAPGEIVVFEHYENCHPGFLRILSDLAVKGSAPLSSRYLVNKEGILVEAGTALAPGAVSRIDPCGKYLIFFSRKGREALADKFGASFVAAVGDVCQTAPFTPEALAALAAQQLNALAQRVHSRLGLTLAAGAEVRDYVAAQCSKEKGAEGLADCCERIFRALSEYCLQTDAKLSGTVALTVAPEGLQFALNGAAPADLFSLLPAAYTGAVEQIRAELDALVGLAPVKEYVFGLADNLQVQQRRAAAGFKTASLSMHMIFTGNPGTGKTTIARLVAKYLKAIGALGGGQLVEVTRADLVGRYTGHTAPLTNSVIESALGGVLFIDEAYSLYRGQQDSFGLEAIDTLVKGMEDHRDELVVILAGYTKEMEVFLTANSGLASRFPNKIEFPDYTADELLDITTVLAKGKGYRLAESCTFPLLGYYKRRQALDSRTAGNGRLARNTLEKAIFNQSRRLIAEPAAELDLIQPSDLEFEE